MVSDYLLEGVYSYPLVDDVLLYFSNLYDNYFFVLFVPGPWSFELVEAWAPSSFWAAGRKIILSDREVGRSSKTYPKNVGGSYYATRLAVLEKLSEIKRQASVVVLREVREGYYAPLGVWQVRENVRTALRGKPFKFSSVSEALRFIKEELGGRVEPEEWKRHSWILRGRQTNLDQWGSGP